VAFGVDPAEAIFDDGDLETGLEKVFGGVADAVFGGDAGNIYHFGPEQVQHIGKALARFVAALETGILFLRRITALIECKFFVHERKKVVVDCATAGACNAVRRPGAALLYEGAMVCGMMVADEEHGKPGLLFDKCLGVGHGLFGVAAGKGSTGNEIVDFVDDDYCFFHDQSLLIVTTAQASQPSPLPTNPSLSVVVAFTLTASRPTPIMGARVARIVSI